MTTATRRRRPAKCPPPRIEWVPEHVRSRVKDAVDCAGRAGIMLDEHQRRVLKGACGVLEDGTWAATEVGVCEPRQNGKNVILLARELAGLFVWGDGLIIHSAHQFDTSAEHFRQLQNLIEDTPEFDRMVKRVSRSHGEEGIELRNGSRIRFRTRTKGGGRGFSCDTLILDEAMYLPESVHGALLPTMRARPNPQLWYAGSAVDQDIHEHGVVFARARERGVRGDAEALAYFEWSLPYEHPGDVPDEVLRDPRSWRSTNPAFGVRIDEEHFELELESMAQRNFAVEILGVGDWPRTDGRADMPVSPERWADCEDRYSQLLDPVCLAFDVSPERRVSIGAAGRREDGRFHVEVLPKMTGTSWLPARLAELVDLHDPLEVVCDALGPSASLVEKIEQAGVTLRKVSGPEHAQACGRLVDAVEEDTLRHLGSLDLWNAIRGAATRPLGDAWAWSRKNSTVDISPLVAVTLALSAAMGMPDDGLEVNIL